MKLLVVGSGGREHAMCCKLQESKRVTEVYAAPGSAGISIDGAHSTGISELDHDALIQFAKEKEIDLTIVGPEVPLVNGIVDDFEAAGLRIFGPSKAAAQLEGSKEFAKKIMVDYHIPTAEYASFADISKAKAYVLEKGAPIVVKADGLAAGKGVIVAETEADALAALDDIMGDRAFGDAGSLVVIEECLRGEELSLMAFVSGETVIPMVPAQDHKRAFDGDAGPNTGGMGAYSPVPQIDDSVVAEAERTILRPMAKAMVAEGVPFTGILYAGLMITEAGPKVIEFNARFGDPETQVVLPRLKSDLVDVIEGVMAGEEVVLSWTEEACAGVVLASDGYPGSYKKGVAFAVPGDDILGEGQKWYHAGTKQVDGKWQTNGGRVILLSSLGTDFKEALERTYQVIDAASFDGLFYRKDIGQRAINLADVRE